MDFDDRFNTESAGHLDLSTVTAGLVLAGRYRLDSLLAFSHGVMTWRAVDQILSPHSHKDLFDAAGSGLPA